MSGRFSKRRTLRLRDRVTFQELPSTVDNHGQPDVGDTDWTDVRRNVEAEVSATGGGPNTRDGQLEETVVSTVVIRKPHTNDEWYPTADMRVKHNSRNLMIKRILDVDGNRRYLTIQCVEVA